MAVISAEDGKVVATVPIGDGVDANAFDPETKLAFASTGDGHLTVAHQDGDEQIFGRRRRPHKKIGSHDGARPEDAQHLSVFRRI